MSVLKLSKADARRAMARYHFGEPLTLPGAFHKLRSVQFDPISPVGCNHDLVLQARVPEYQVGDWESITYQDRQVFDGWDKCACLIPLEGWGWRQIFHHWHRLQYDRIFVGYAEAVQIVLKELEERGPLLPRELLFQERREDWKVSWHGPNVSKQVLRALFYTGKVMTVARKNGHHVYDLTERVLPAELLNAPMPTEEEGKRSIVLERHLGVGLVSPKAAYEMWSYQVYAGPRSAILKDLVAEALVVPVDIEGFKCHASPALLAELDKPSQPPTVRFIAPLDQFIWDRKLIQAIFGFEYIWEIYTPEAKRRWGYYVLPVLYGDQFVGRVEFRLRKQVLEVVGWHWEEGPPPDGFIEQFSAALRSFLRYCGASSLSLSPSAAWMEAYV